MSTIDIEAMRELLRKHDEIKGRLARLESYKRDFKKITAVGIVGGQLYFTDRTDANDVAMRCWNVPMARFCGNQDDSNRAASAALIAIERLLDSEIESTKKQLDAITKTGDS